MRASSRFSRIKESEKERRKREYYGISVFPSSPLFPSLVIALVRAGLEHASAGCVKRYVLFRLLAA